MTEKLQKHLESTINDIVTPFFKLLVLTLRDEAIGMVIESSFDYMSLDGSGRCDFKSRLVEVSDEGILIKNDVDVTPLSSMN